jgi:superfamily II DNA or RNA helicase
MNPRRQLGMPSGGTPPVSSEGALETSPEETEIIHPGDLVQLLGPEKGGPFLCLTLIRSTRGLTARVTPSRPQDTGGGIREVLVSDLVRATLDLDPYRDTICRLVLPDLGQLGGGRGLVSFRANATFKPFQFRPLLKYFSVASRHLLLADETGLGKTVEAGYIVLEEIARGNDRRIGILCPSRLRSKWRYELWKRFGLRFPILQSSRALEQALMNTSPTPHWIASSDIARGYFSTGRRIPEQARLDLLIVDEVHEYIGRSDETARRRLGIELAEHANGILGISATPIQLELEDLLRVLDIVLPRGFDKVSFSSEVRLVETLAATWRGLIAPQWGPREKAAAVDHIQVVLSNEELCFPGEACRLRHVLGMINSLPPDAPLRDRQRIAREGSNFAELSRHIVRTRGVEVGEDRRREIKDIVVDLSEDTYTVVQQNSAVQVSERRVFEALDTLFRTAFSLSHRAQLSSCLPAMSGLLAAGERGFASWEAVGEEQENLAGSFAKELTEQERMTASRLAGMHSALLVDSKLAALRGLLNQLQEEQIARKAVLFTHWLPTHNYLAERLKGQRLFIARPDTEEELLEKVVRGFRDSEGFSVLLTTDILREGVDLDAADALINYDLPFNPQVLEQRIGRIDRVTQTSRTLHIFHLLVRGSLDETIYERYHRRVRFFQRPLGTMRPISQAMMEELAQTGDLAPSEVLCETARQEDEARLMEHGPFSGVEMALDEEIQRLHREQGYDPRAYLWIAYWRSLSLLFPLAEVSWSPTEHAIRVSQLPSNAEEWIGGLGELWDREEVTRAVRAARDEQGGASWILPPSPDTLLSVFHPLSKIMICVAERSYGNRAKAALQPIWLALDEESAMWQGAVDALLLVRRERLKGDEPNTQDRWYSWGRGQGLLERQDLNLSSFLRCLLEGPPNCTLANADLELETALTEALGGPPQRLSSQPTSVSGFHQQEGQKIDEAGRGLGVREAQKIGGSLLLVVTRRKGLGDGGGP